MEEAGKDRGPRRAAQPGRGSATRGRGGVQSVQRTLDVLEALAARGGEAAFAQIKDDLGLPPSTVHRILATLASRGYVRQDPYTGRYRIGSRAFQVGCCFLEPGNLRDLARPVMRALVARAGESVNLAVRDGDAAMYVETAESSQTVRTFARIGAQVPLHCTGVGKALLLGASPEEIRRIARQCGLKAYTPHTLTRLEDLLAEVVRGREAGYVLDREEYELGVRCAAAPVRDHTGQVVAALSASGPAYRLTDATLATLARWVRAAAEELSRALGYAAGAVGVP